MGKLTELQQWEEDIYQIETSDPVLGGPDGITNKPARQLSNRTQWLKAQLEAAQNALAVHQRSRNHPDATLTEKGFTKLYSGVMSLDETMAVTPKAVKIAMDNANARLAKERNGADIPNVALFRQNLELGNSATRNVGTTIDTVAAGDDSRILAAKKAVDDTQIGRPNQSLIRINTPDDLSNLPAGARRFAQNAPGVSVLPTGAYFYLEVIAKRDVANGTAIRVIEAHNPTNEWTGTRYNTSTETGFTWSKQYNTLSKPTAADVGTDTTAQIDSKVAAAKKAGTDAQLTANGAVTAAANANTNANGRVPNTRTVNNKALSTNITLNASDVGAVPTTRTINGKSLLTDLILTAADLGITIPKNTALLDVNGWWKCGDTGLIIQWGLVRPPPIGHSTVNVPLPTIFPNKGLWAFGYVSAAMPYDNDAISGSAGLLGTAPNTTIRVTTDNGVPTAWIAIGY